MSVGRNLALESDFDLAATLATNEIIIVGLGEVARTHIEALGNLGQTVIAGVDIDPSKELVFKGKRLPVYRSPEDAAKEHHEPDIVVVSVPTPNHHAVSKQIFSAFDSKPVRVLVEKPCADKFEDVIDLYDNAPDNIRLETLLHYAYSPEILWAYEHLEDWLSMFGPIRNFEVTFTDPRGAPDQAHRRQALGSSWIDLGINALSAISRLMDLTKLELRAVEAPYDYQATVSFTSGATAGRGTLATKWNVASSSHDSSFTFSSGAQLILNNYLVEGSLKRSDGAVEMSFSSDGTPRRLSHYINLYRDILGAGNMAIDKSLSLKVHELLLGN